MGIYCIAGDKLDEQLLDCLLKTNGRAIESKKLDSLLWFGLGVITADAATLTMPNRAENQRENALSGTEYFHLEFDFPVSLEHLGELLIDLF